MPLGTPGLAYSESFALILAHRIGPFKVGAYMP